MSVAPLVSVLVPVYNVEKYLRQCLDSIVSQSYKNIEVVIIDDASPDNCPQICEEYKAVYDFIKVIHLNENGGLLNARDVALRNASGEYVYWVDSDDYIGPDRISEMVRPVIEFDVDVAVGAYTRYIEKTGSRKAVRDSFPSGYYSIENYAQIKPLILSFDKKKHNRHISPNVWSKLWKKDLLLPLVGKLPTGLKIGEDGVRTYSALLSASSVYVVDDSSYYYRITGHQMTSCGFVPDYFKYGLWIYSFLLSKYKNTSIEPSIQENIAFIAGNAVINEGFSSKSSNEIISDIAAICNNRFVIDSVSCSSFNNHSILFRFIYTKIRKKRKKVLLLISKLFSIFIKAFN